MSLLNPEWVEFDKHTRALKSSGWYTEVSETIDNEILSACGQRGVTIPTDIDGFIDSPFLRSLSVDYAVFTMLVGNWGVREGDAQVYSDKANYHWGQYEKKLKNLNSILV